MFGEGGQFDINFVCVDARERFYSKLAGVTEPERKRKIIGEEFIRVFEDEAKKIGARSFWHRARSTRTCGKRPGGESATIKSHHNVGGLPDYVDFKEIVEPLRDLFKDEVRRLAVSWVLPEYLVGASRSPAPALPSALSVISPRKRLPLYRMLMPSGARKWKGSPLRHQPVFCRADQHAQCWCYG